MNEDNKTTISLTIEDMGSDGLRVQFCKGIDLDLFKQVLSDAMQSIFWRNGYNVTTDAIVHNFDAWQEDLKSGYRDERNGYHLFTPCGCNPLSFWVSPLNAKNQSWQNTYTC